MRTAVSMAVEEVHRDFLRGVSRGLVVEQSHLGQLHRLLHMYVDVPAGIESFCKSGSNPISPAEVLERLRRLIHDLQHGRQRELESQLD